MHIIMRTFSGHPIRRRRPAIDRSMEIGETPPPRRPDHQLLGLHQAGAHVAVRMHTSDLTRLTHTHLTRTQPLPQDIEIPQRPHHLTPPRRLRRRDPRQRHQPVPHPTMTIHLPHPTHIGDIQHIHKTCVHRPVGTLEIHQRTLEPSIVETHQLLQRRNLEHLSHTNKYRGAVTLSCRGGVGEAGTASTPMTSKIR